LIVDEAKVQRSVMSYWKTDAPTSGAPSRAAFFTSLLAVHTGPVDDIDKLVFIIDHPDATRESRNAAAALLEANQALPDQVLKTAVVNRYKLALKAKLWLRLQPEERDLFLLIASLNSFKALDIALDVIKDRLVDEKIAELVLQQSVTRKAAVKRLKAEQAKELTNYGTVFGMKKFLPGPFIKYGKAVAEALGQDRLRRFLSWFSFSVSRYLAYVTDVLSCPKPKALGPDDLDRLISDFAVIREFGLDVDRAAVAKLSSSLASPDIVAKLEYQNAAALVDASSSLL
jgi:hypothetical protein